MFMFGTSRLNYLKLLTSPLLVRSCSKKANVELVYNFPYARVGSLVNKMKMKTLFLTGATIPISAALEFLSIFPSYSTSTCFIICGATNAAFFSIGQLFYKLVGKVYFDNNSNVVKISYIGFVGARTDIEIPLDEILPPGDEAPGTLYSKIRFTNSELVLKINEKYYDYCNVKLSRRIFGESFHRL